VGCSGTCGTFATREPIATLPVIVGPEPFPSPQVYRYLTPWSRRTMSTSRPPTFFEGHVHALRVLGGVPRGRVRYDNLKAAVAQVLGLSRARVETDRWIAFRSDRDVWTAAVNDTGYTVTRR
jgi:hypothetical protein